MTAFCARHQNTSVGEVIFSCSPPADFDSATQLSLHTLLQENKGAQRAALTRWLRLPTYDIDTPARDKSPRPTSQFPWNSPNVRAQETNSAGLLVRVK
jgi:hypothetical protein